MKQLNAEAAERIASTRPVIAGAAKFAFGDEPYCYWSGLGKIEIDGDIYIGLGNAALIAPISSSVGGSASALMVTVSDLDPDVAVLIEDETYHQKPATIRRLVFDEDGHELLDTMVFMRGRVDFIAESAEVGGKSTLEIAIEGPRRDMGRAGGRTSSNADQRTLGGPGDASHKHLSVAGNKTLYWGQKPSVAKDTFLGIPTSGLNLSRFGLMAMH